MPLAMIVLLCVLLNQGTIGWWTFGVCLWGTVVSLMIRAYQIGKHSDE
jgi:hypothetical protein